MPEPDPHVRVSDAERQAVVDRLSSAVGDGLLTLDEFADHAGRAYAAVTRGQLDDVTRELRLPVLAAPPPPPPPPAAHRPAPSAHAPVQADPQAAAERRRWVVAIMSSEERKGRWRANRHMGAFACMGAVELDLRDALLDDDVVDISAWAVMGGVTVVVPEGIAVESSGFMLMGGRSNRIKDVAPLPGGPVVRVRGYGMWGGIDVRSKPRRGPSPPPEPAAVPAAAPAVPPRLPPEPESPPGYLPQAGLVSLVCTDLVGSTRLSERLGDQRWRHVLREHNAIVRDQLARHGGHEVKTSGDGFLCTFTSARRAVAFAADVQEAIAEWHPPGLDGPLQLRIGVHAGEVEHDGDDLVGRNVALVCRLCDAAGPGEVLVSGVVADLAETASDLAFGDERQLTLSGIERPVAARPARRR